MKAIRDPIHNIIIFDKDKEKLLLDLLDTKEMQRLRHIKQLGFSSYTYPGAEHTRFAHSLGVTHLTHRFIDKTVSIKAPEYRTQLEELQDNKLLVCAAALLHDIGHGPFSHALESVTGISHEKWTTKIIMGNTEVNQVLTGQGFNPKEVAEIIQRNHNSSVMVKLLSSQLDADRTDYLLRDSIMTGAGYGKFDLEWLINVLKVGIVKDKLEIGLDLDKGKSIAEDYVMARYYMYLNVYFHKTTRSAELMMRQIVKKASDLNIELPPGISKIKNEGINDETLKLYLRLNENTIWNYVEQWLEHPELNELCNGIINRKLYKVLPKASPMAIVKLAHEIGQRDSIDPYSVVLHDTPSTSSYKDPYLSEPSSEEHEEASEQIFLFDRRGKPTELCDVSDIIRQLRNQKIGFERYYVPPKYRKEFEEVL